MRYRKFHEYELSELGLGCMRLPAGEGPDSVDREKAVELIRYAYDHGVNYFDTAYRYHAGESELVVAEALSVYPRESYCLVSKFPGHMLSLEPDGRIAFTGFPGRKVFFDDPKALFEEQLRKCGTDYFDIYHLHNVNERSIEMYTNEELGLVEYLKEEKKNGRIRHLGFSSHGSAELIDSFLTKFEGVFDAVQIQINYLDWTLQDAKAKYEVIEKHGIPVISMESIRGGALAALPESAAEVLKKADPDTTQAAWALRWLQALPNVAVVLSGMSSMEQLKENLKTFEEPKPVTEKENEMLLSLAESMTSRIPCTACRYCSEGCPAGLEIPDLLARYNEYKSGQSLMPVVRGMEQVEKDKWPDQCLNCGACKAVCPQGIDIPLMLREFAALIKA